MADYTSEIKAAQKGKKKKQPAPDVAIPYEMPEGYTDSEEDFAYNAGGSLSPGRMGPGGASMHGSGPGNVPEAVMQMQNTLGGAGRAMSGVTPPVDPVNVQQLLAEHPEILQQLLSSKGVY